MASQERPLESQPKSSELLEGGGITSLINYMLLLGKNEPISHWHRVTGRTVLLQEGLSPFTILEGNTDLQDD